MKIIFCSVCQCFLLPEEAIEHHVKAHPLRSEDFSNEDLRSAAYIHYMNNVSEDAGFYYREADEVGLLAVYKLGVEHGMEQARG